VEGVLEPFETENPFLLRLFAMPEFGDVPRKAPELLQSVSPDAEEQLLAALHLRHGRYRVGYLLLTTAMLRWVQTAPFRDHDYWTYDYALEIEGGPLMGAVIRTPDGKQFQRRWGRAKSFGEMFRLAQQAVAWQHDHSVTTSAVASKPSGDPDPVAALERLAELRQQGLLDDEEFNAAKRKVLGLG
jgi:hypothetical protein